MLMSYLIFRARKNSSQILLLNTFIGKVIHPTKAPLSTELQCFPKLRTTSKLYVEASWFNLDPL